MGRSSLIMVLGFTTALLMIGSNISKVSSAAMDNYVYYYNNAMAHSVAGAGMNMASRALFENSLWTAGFSNKSFANGTFNVTVQNLGGNKIKVVSTGSFFGAQRVVSCVLQPSSFSRFNYYSVTDQNGFWGGGDTIWGPFHCNNTINVAYFNGGSPVFMQKATSLNGIWNYNGAHPVFKGGYASGVNVTLPANLTPLQTAAQSGGKYFTGAGGDVFIQLNSDGTVTWRQGGAADWTGTGWTTTPISSFAPNGAVYLTGANLRLKGTLHGQLTIGVGGTTASTTQGNMWLDNDIVYKDDPRHGYSTDMLGLVAENKLWITDNTMNRGPNNDFVLMASVFSRTDGLWAQNYGSRPVEGKLTTVGGQIQNVGGYTGTFSGNTIVNGFKPGGTYYDDRLMNDAPPFFPTTGNFEVVSWFE
jgi:hypothetical protein